VRQIYTNELYVLAENSKNRLEAEGIEVQFRNEFSSAAAVAGQSVWPELWVNDSDYEKALQILATSHDSEASSSWICSHCKEKNPGNFSICWKCQAHT
jgi:hypothetical protein